MRKQSLITIVVLILMVLLSSGCKLITDVADVDDLDKVLTEGKKLAEDAVGYVDENAPYAKIIARATEWVAKGVPYGYLDDEPGDDYQDGYRTDSPGFLSYAWRLEDENGKRISVDAPGLAAYATQIPFDDLKPGDSVNNLRPGDEGHVVMFVSWVPGTNNSKFVAMEMSRSEGKAIQMPLSLRVDEQGARFLKEYADTVPGPYVALRLNALVTTGE